MLAMHHHPDKELQEKLFQIATKRRSFHGHPAVILPNAISPLESIQLFDQQADSYRILELGCGWGEFCCEWLKKFPDHNYIAMEINGDRIKRLIKQTNSLTGQKNLRIIPINFKWFLCEILPAKSFDLMIINFPDPWPKKRHWKHRLIEPGFPEKAASLLRKNGRIFMATDYGPYARKILKLFRENPHFEAVYEWPHYRRTPPGEHPVSRFQTMHLQAGRKSYYQEWQLGAAPPQKDDDSLN